MADKRSQIPAWHRMCDRRPHRSHPGWACLQSTLPHMCTKWCIREEGDAAPLWTLATRAHSKRQMHNKFWGHIEADGGKGGRSALESIHPASQDALHHHGQRRRLQGAHKAPWNTTVWPQWSYRQGGLHQPCAALRNLISDCSKRRVMLRGQGCGRLTAESIRKLQIYYSRAIRRAKTAEEMRQNILASVYHGYSTDDLPQHQFCPPGPDSWCFFKRSIGEHLHPTGHRKRVHTPLDYDLLHRYLEPIFDRLASLQLLRKCELKTTQNPNESFHHSVWSRCSKKNFHSLKRVEFALKSAAAEFNSGPYGLKTVKQSIGFHEGEHGQRLGGARLKKRLYKSTLVEQKKAKKKEKDDCCSQREGETGKGGWWGRAIVPGRNVLGSVSCMIL